MILKINGNCFLDPISGPVFVTAAHCSLYVRGNCFIYSLDECQPSKGKTKYFHEKDLLLEETFVASR
jgi:hypothetical protein